MSEKRILNNDYGLAEMQEDLLITLDEFDSICRAHNIFYALHGGTMLGAERNHHMIPWDDDIDVTMTRTEFEKLREVIRGGNIPEGFYLDEKTMWFPRFVMKKKAAPVYVDILVWDYISEKKLAQLAKITLLRSIQGMMKEDVDYSRYNLKGKILVGTTQAIGKLISTDNKLKLFHKIEKEMFLGKKLFIHRSNDSYKGCAYILDSHYMDDYTEIELEGKKYYVNKRYHEFLVMEYGPDYLTPPPEKDRHPGHEQFRKSIKRKQNA